VDQYANITAAQDMFAWLHETTGQPWWLCIAAITIAVRICTFPVTLRSIKNGPRLFVAK
jgi:membrane protein insertase Oxa1/YidC/SpoIIIJ